jgi:hypothetical protein
VTAPGDDQCVAAAPPDEHRYDGLAMREELLRGDEAPGSSFARLLEALGWAADERLSVDWLPVDWLPVRDKFRGTIHTVAQAPGIAMAHAASSCVWFGTQALHRDAAGRGKARDVVGWRSLTVDLDYVTEHRANGVPDEAAALVIVAEVSALLGCRPVALVHSGHGLQPHWLIARGPETDWPNAEDARHIEATALSRRFGRVVEQVVTAHGWHIDKVSDLSRTMRVPGTSNRKWEPVEVRAEFEDPHPGGVTVERIRAACDAAGVGEVATDRNMTGTVGRRRTVAAAPPDEHRYDGLAMREELLRGTPIRDYHPTLSAEDCAFFARLIDETRARRARRLVQEKRASSAKAERHRPGKATPPAA